MPQLTITCFSCGTQAVVADIVGRGDTCAKCHADLRCCKNCCWYDTTAANQCREPTAEFVGDKERANFCGMFKPFSGNRSAATDEVASAKAKLEALFKKM